MNESTTRIVLGLAGAIAFVFYVLAIIFGLQPDQALGARALIYLILAFLSTIVAFVFYRRYTHLRQLRWQGEMKAGEEKMRQLLTEETEPAKHETQNAIE
jgi:hypothetical protein